MKEQSPVYSETVSRGCVQVRATPLQHVCVDMRVFQMPEVKGYDWVCY